jgi:diguanylate cyclase (GGDEF)-like protein
MKVRARAGRAFVAACALRASCSERVGFSRFNGDDTKNNAWEFDLGWLARCVRALPCFDATAEQRRRPVVSESKGETPTHPPPKSERGAVSYDVDTTAIRGRLRRRPHLFVVAGTHSVGMVVPITDGMTLGRALECDIVVAEQQVSRKHARFSIDANGDVCIEDVGSTHGIFRSGGGGHRISSPTVVREGERFTIGGLTITLVNVDDRADDLGDTFRRNLLRSSVEDAATKLLTGAALLDAIGRQFRFAERCGQPLTALIIDVEPLDNIRRKFGRAGAAFVLRRVAAAMSVSTLQSPDAIVGLYRDDRLVVVLPGSTLENAQATAEWIRSSVSDTAIVYDGERIPVSVCIGCATSTESPEALLHAGRDALERARSDSTPP